MTRVVGTDPGTSSLDLLLLADGAVADQVRLPPEVLRQDPGSLAAQLRRWEPLDLIAGPSGYGLPLVRRQDLTARHLEEMTLVRPEETGRDAGVLGFRSLLNSLARSEWPVVFLPGGIHLPTIPRHRKVNSIDLGTADKVAVAALALRSHAAEGPRGLAESTFAVVEIGSVFTAVLVVSAGRLVDASAGTRGPLGLGSAGCWDGEAAYWRGPLAKADLFRGGLVDLGDDGPAAFRESLARHAAGLKAITSFEHVFLSGSMAARPDIHALAVEALEPLGRLIPLPDLPGAWVKHAAQGSALLADGLAGGRHADLVERLMLRQASGSVLDWLR